MAIATFTIRVTGWSQQTASRGGQAARRRGGRATTWLAVAAAVCWLATAPPPASAADEGDAVTLTGEVLDATCYLAHGRKGAGPGHRRCAEECINKKNLPIALVTDKEEVVLLVPDHANERPYEELKSLAAETVVVEGKRFTRGGLPGVVVSSVKKK